MRSILPTTSTTPTPKLTITTSSLGAYIDPSQPPTKRSPWRQIHSVPFIHSATLIMPDELYHLISPHLNLNPTLTVSRYAKVIMKLEDILTGAFFTMYLKTPGSNVLMISEGTPGVDERFELREGVLRMEMGKEVYERCGLQGKAVRGGERKHVKMRYEVVVDLRRVEMVGGKKGFERVLWAARNVLDRAVGWLFVDLGKGEGEGKGVVEGWYPTCLDVRGEERLEERVLVPEGLLLDGLGARVEEEQDKGYEIVEWLDLVALSSGRVKADDDVDHYISRYSVPDQERAKMANLRAITWTGLLSSTWVMKLSIEIIKQSRLAKAQHWLAMSVTSHRTDAVGQVDGYTIVFQPSGSQGDGDVEMANTAETERPAGLQRSLCFQFIDSSTAG